MNYIRHLNAFFQTKRTDSRLGTTHVSAYLALFHTWNLNHFQSPHSATREEIMSLAGIGSKNTYHKCMHELQAFGYIIYNPSNNPFSKSRFEIKMIPETNVIPGNINTLNVSKTIHYQTEDKYDAVPNMRPFIKQNVNNINLANIKNEIPEKEEVRHFFSQQKQAIIEADKFFLFYESIGWLIGGKTPVKNWKAAAHKWIIKSSTFHKTKSNAKSNKCKISDQIDYSEPF